MSKDKSRTYKVAVTLTFMAQAEDGIDVGCIVAGQLRMAPRRDIELREMTMRIDPVLPRERS